MQNATQSRSRQYISGYHPRVNHRDQVAPSCMLQVYQLACAEGSDLFSLFATAEPDPLSGNRQRRVFAPAYSASRRIINCRVNLPWRRAVHGIGEGAASRAGSKELTQHNQAPEESGRW